MPGNGGAATGLAGGTQLKSAQFRREREANWRALESLLAQAESSGLRSLSGDNLLRLPSLYRATLSALSVARSISLDRNLVTYLETLAARAYFHIYGPRAGLPAAIGTFLRHTLPAAIRQMKWPILLSAAVLFLGAGSGYAVTLANVDWFYTFVDIDLAAGRTPSASTEYLRSTLFDPPPATDRLAAFASELFTHNAKITLLCFALGIAFGIPTLLLLFSNGLMMGAFVALFASRGLGTDMLGWLWIHGTTEIFAIILGGGAGCAIGEAALFPGEKSRIDNLAERGKLAGVIALGAVLMLFVAGGLEGIGRQMINDTMLRYGIGSVMLVGWLAYFSLAGASKQPDRETGR
ncbi:MAG: stage II sporulation protein M [Rhodospirillaceae bacterium]|nr:stage II sporulation protein M [Rhodospirillaceae bacterium]